MKAKKILSLLLCILMFATAIPFSASAVTVINTIDALIPIPTVGDNPTNKGVFVNGKGIGIDFDIDWCYEDGTILKSDEKFEYGVKYLCVLDITTEENYMFSNDFQMSYAVNGNVVPDEMTDYRSYHKIYINYEFKPNPIKIGDFDVTIPISTVGNHPTSLGLTVGTNNVNYDVEWLDKNKNKMSIAEAYEADTDYYCCITIKAKDGYVFKTDMKVNVNGADFNYGIKSDTQIQIVYKFRPSPIEVKRLTPVITLPAVGATESDLKVTDASEKVYIFNKGLYYADNSEVADDAAVKADTEYFVAILYNTNPGYAFVKADDLIVDTDGAEVFLAISNVAVIKYGFKYNSVTVNGGSASANVALPGEVVTITAPQVAGKVFSSWAVKGAVAANTNAQETTVTAGDEAITATANYNDCSCNCHGNFLQKLIFKITNFFAALFNPSKKICACGMKH